MKKSIDIKLQRDAEWNEWVVAVYINGKYNEDHSYRTDDKQDAIGTMNTMKESVWFETTAERLGL